MVRQLRISEVKLLTCCTAYRRSPWKCTRTAGDVQEGNQSHFR